MFTLSVRDLIRQKAPKANIPSWAVRLLQWIVCEKDLNELAHSIGDREGIDFARAMTEHEQVRFTISGLDEIPNDGRYMFVSNHPLGAFDGICYIRILGEKFGRIKAIVNDMLMIIKPLQSTFLPVSTIGRPTRESLLAIEDAYASDMPLVSFPAGFCSRYIDGRIQDIAWQKSVITQSVRYQRDIVPMYFEGRNSTFFYLLEWLRRKLGMRFNIGLLLLPRQMLHTAWGQHYRIVVGKPIPYSTFDSSRTPTEWAQWLREECYKLK